MSNVQIIPLNLVGPKGNLEVEGTTTIDGAVTVGGGLDVTGNVRLGAPGDGMADHTGALTLSVANSGTHFILTGTGGIITLPALARGLNWKFTVGGTGFSTDYVITAPSTDLEGTYLAAGLVQDVDGDTTATLDDGQENIGDWYEVWSDGTSYFFTGMCLSATAVGLA